MLQVPLSNIFSETKCWIFITSKLQSSKLRDINTYATFLACNDSRQYLPVYYKATQRHTGTNNNALLWVSLQEPIKSTFLDYWGEAAVAGRNPGIQKKNVQTPCSSSRNPGLSCCRATPQHQVHLNRYRILTAVKATWTTLLLLLNLKKENKAWKMDFLQEIDEMDTRGRSLNVIISWPEA